MAKPDAKKAAEEADKRSEDPPQIDERDARIVELEAALADAKKAAEEADASTRRLRASLDDARAEIALMVEDGASRAEPTNARILRVRARNPKLSGFCFHGVALGPDFVDLDVTGMTAEQIEDVFSDPIAEVVEA